MVTIRQSDRSPAPIVRRNSSIKSRINSTAQYRILSPRTTHSMLPLAESAPGKSIHATTKATLLKTQVAEIRCTYSRMLGSTTMWTTIKTCRRRLRQHFHRQNPRLWSATSLTSYSASMSRSPTNRSIKLLPGRRDRRQLNSSRSEPRKGKLSRIDLCMHHGSQANGGLMNLSTDLSERTSQLQISH